ncbi:MAG: hypothetical protein ABI743_15245, partial [bacterium]
LTIKPQWIGLSLEFIAWLINAPPIARLIEQLTATKRIFPQINQHQLLELPCPDFDRLRDLQRQLEAGAPAFLATGASDTPSTLYIGPTGEALRALYDSD